MVLRTLLLTALLALLFPAAAPVAAAPATEFLIGVHPGVSLSAAGRASGPDAAALNALLQPARPGAAVSLGSGSGAYRVRIHAAGELPALLQQLRNNPAVRYAEYNHSREVMRTPNDPVVRQQWALRNIQAFDAWDITTGGQITIAILDTGVSDSHPDLRGRVLDGYNFVAGNTNTDDDDGHGTYVAGVAAAIGDNEIGIAGICWECRILPVKVLDRNGRGDDASVAAGIRWAVDQGVRIISMSLGGTNESQTLRDAVRYAYDRNVLVIVASGNGQADGNRPTYPAAYPEVLAVSATDGSDTVTGFSTTGEYVDISAPGVGVWSTGWSREAGNTYEAQNGTSAACPHVAGAAALALSIRPDLSVVQLMALLQAAADDRGPPGRDAEHGAGRLNLLRSVQLAQNPEAIPAAPQPPQPGNDPAPGAFQRVPPPTDGTLYFTETGHTLRGVFREYWATHGGLPIFGFPISEEFNERGEDGVEYVVQYFERHRFEYHPENRAPYNVLLSRLGITTLERQGRDWRQFGRGARDPGCLVFEETGQSICEPFLSYWRANGLEFDGRRGKSAAESLALFGLPISPPQVETLADGRSYMVQWFERARFEDHGADGVLLGLLSSDLAQARGWR